MASSFAGYPAKLLAQDSATNVRAFGAVGDGSRNDTAAFAAALAVSRTIWVPGGVYLVDRIVIPAGRRVLTAGFKTIFRQRRGTPDATRLISIVGSNVRLGDCTVQGNIATDFGEQHHGIFIEASSTTGDLANITIGNVRGADMRGDVVYVGARDARRLSLTRIGHIHGDNILRNVVSICGGRGISVERVSGSEVGYTHLDIEPDDYNGPVSSCSIGAVVGSLVQIAGQTPAASVDGVRIGLLDLSSPAKRSVPHYAPGLSREDALTIRNVRSLEIGRLIAHGFGGQAMRQIWDPGALTDQKVHIARAEVWDCCRDRRATRAYFLGDPRATRLRIDSLAVDTIRPGIDVVRNCQTARVGHVEGKIPKGSKVIAQSSRVLDGLLYVVGGSAILLGGGLTARRLVGGID